MSNIKKNDQVKVISGKARGKTGRILRILTEKGQINHRDDGPRYVYLPSKSAERAQEDALEHVVRTFFDGSHEQAMTALLRISDAELSDAEIDRLRDRIRRARSSGR